MTYDILVLKSLCRKYESLCRKSRLTVNFDMYSESCKSKSVILQKKISMVIRRSFSKLLTPC